MIPDISAGSNQVGASETCTPRVSWFAGLPARAGPEPAAISSAAISAKETDRAACGNR